MAGAIIIVVVLLLIPVLVLMSGGDRVGHPRPGARARRRGSATRAASSSTSTTDVDADAPPRRRDRGARPRPIVRYAVERVRPRPAAARRPAHAGRAARRWPAPTITPEGIGGLEALRIFGDVLAPACISVDHPRFLSFVPAAPTEASILFDLVVGASSIYGGSWLEGGGAVFAENEALRWIADLAGLPADGRRRVRQRRHGGQPQRARRRPLALAASGPAAPTTAPAGLLLASGGAHSSVAQAARAMDADVVAVPADDGGRLTGDALRATVDGLDAADRERLFAVVATAGTTNAGVIDDLRGRRRRRRRARHVAARRRRLRRRRPRRAERPPTASPASRPPTASSSTRTSGCSPRSTRAPCSTATPRSAGAPTPSTPSTSTCSTPTTSRRVTSGTPRTTPTTCPAGPAGCRSGSAWPRTAPTPTATPSRPRCASPARAPSSCARRRTSS